MSKKCTVCNRRDNRPVECKLCKFSFHKDCDDIRVARVGRGFLRCCSVCRENRIGVSDYLFAARARPQISNEVLNRSISLPDINMGSHENVTSQVNDETGVPSIQIDVNSFTGTDGKQLATMLETIIQKIGCLPAIQRDLTELKTIRKSVDTLSGKIDNVIAETELNKKSVSRIENSQTILSEKVTKNTDDIGNLKSLLAESNPSLNLNPRPN